MTMLHLSAEDIVTYLDDECTTAEREAAQHHLEVCAECRQIANDQKFIKNLLSELPEPELPRSFALTPGMVEGTVPTTSPASVPGAAPARSNLVRFEPVARFLSIAAVLAFLVLGGAQVTGIGSESDSGPSQAVELSETNAASDALQEQEPALVRGEVREQGESAAAHVPSQGSELARVDIQQQVSDSGLTPLEITTIGVGIVALAAIAAWILIHYRAANHGNQS